LIRPKITRATRTIAASCGEGKARTGLMTSG